MRQLFITFLILTLASSCLKESIADAMMEKQNGNHPAVATITYEVNGNTVTNSISKPDSQSPTAYQLGCNKTYNLNGTSGPYYFGNLGTTGELTFVFATDSLAIGHYSMVGNYDYFILSYNGTNAYLADPADSIAFNITSSGNGHISGNFLGRLSPLTSQDASGDHFGAPGSIVITKGSFTNVPVFY